MDKKLSLNLTSTSTINSFTCIVARLAPSFMLDFQEIKKYAWLLRMSIIQYGN